MINSQTPPYTTVTWHALGSDCQLVIFDPTGHSHRRLAQTIITQTRRFEQTCSRFLPDSELTRFNGHPAGRWSVSPEFSRLLRLAQSMNRLTDGFFDPTIITVLTDYGYTNSDNNWPLTIKTPPTDKPEIIPKVEKLIIHHDGTVTKPDRLQLDLGGIGKSYLLRQLALGPLRPVANYYLSLGGDIVVHGLDGRHPGWEVVLDHPSPMAQQPPTTKIIMKSGALCTSGTAKRRGTTGGTAWHHIIDPQTRKSLQTRIAAATVSCPDPVWAEQVARLALKEERHLDAGWLRQHHCQEIWLTDRQGLQRHYHA